MSVKTSVRVRDIGFANRNPIRKRKKTRAVKRRKVTRVKRNPETKYNAQAVNAAIAASNRAGRRIGGKEAKLIHALLQGRKPSTVKKNPSRKATDWSALFDKAGRLSGRKRVAVIKELKRQQKLYGPTEGKRRAPKITRARKNPYRAHYLMVNTTDGRKLYYNADGNSFGQKKFAWEFANRHEAVATLKRIKEKILRNVKIRDVWVVT